MKMIALQYGEYIVVDREPDSGYRGSLGECEYIIEEDPLTLLEELERSRDRHLAQLAEWDAQKNPLIHIQLHRRSEVQEKADLYQRHIDSLLAALDTITKGDV